MKQIMKHFPSAAEASKRFDLVQKEIQEKVYEVSERTHSILSNAIEAAMREWKRDVSISSRGYDIDEGGGLIQNFLEQQGYENVLVEETWYSCFDNDRGQTQIVFSF